MPFIHVRTTREVSKQQEKNLAAHFGSAMPVIGKSEEWLMVGLEEKCHLYFRGRDEQDLCFVTVAVFGKMDPAKADLLTEKITAAIGEQLHISPDCIYIQYQEASMWGWNGSNF
ncbi:MAG: hypothetical protein E7326_08340 [Clostridiales bacterium]|nr:hypothetical protein [Clostridiales bacterium]